jgi:hypothetical protein
MELSKILLVSKSCGSKTIRDKQKITIDTEWLQYRFMCYESVMVHVEKHYNTETTTYTAPTYSCFF